jgi:hypothetical protein
MRKPIPEWEPFSRGAAGPRRVCRDPDDRFVLVVLAAACHADPCRDVQPMAPPLGASSPGEAPAAITVIYSRPVARGRELFGALVWAGPGLGRSKEKDPWGC